MSGEESMDTGDPVHTEDDEVPTKRLKTQLKNDEEMEDSSQNTGESAGESENPESAILNSSKDDKVAGNVQDVDVEMEDISQECNNNKNSEPPSSERDDTGCGAEGDNDPHIVGGDNVGAEKVPGVPSEPTSLERQVNKNVGVSVVSNEESVEMGGGSCTGGSEADNAAERERSRSSSPGNDTDASEEDGSWREIYIDRQFPKTLKGFKYEFKDGRLAHIDTGEPFNYEVKKGDRHFNQKHYEALGEVITDEVYQLLEGTGMERVQIPEDASKYEARSFFFRTKGALQKEKLLILIHGSGAVRAGQWARSLIINKDIDSGTQIPYIKRGVQEEYGVLVLNTNENYAEVKGSRRPIRENATPQQHARYVWQNYVQSARADRIDIVAHSYGGVVTVDLLSEFSDDFLKRVQKIAFTDSVHTLYSAKVTRRMANWLIRNARNWVSSDDELDTPQPSYFSDGRDISRVSAGTPKHVETSWKSYESVFRYLLDQEAKSSQSVTDSESATGSETAESSETAEGSESTTTKKKKSGSAKASKKKKNTKNSSKTKHKSKAKQKHSDEEDAEAVKSSETPRLSDTKESHATEENPSTVGSSCQNFSEEQSAPTNPDSAIEPESSDAGRDGQSCDSKL